MTTKINAELVKILSKDQNLRLEAEQILERLSVPKNTPPTLGQKESLQFCCKLLDSAVALDDAIKQTLEKDKSDAVKAKSVVPEVSVSEGANREVSAALAPTKDRPMPGLAVQDNAPSWRPSRDVKAIQLAESEMKEAAKDIAQAVSGAPFGGINDAVDYAESQIRAIRGEWSDAVFDQVEDELNSDEMSFFLEKTYVGKRRKLSEN
jgi:hypothetical protein